MSRAPRPCLQERPMGEDRGGPQTQDMLVPGETGRSVRGVVSGSRTHRTGWLGECWLRRQKERGMSAEGPAGSRLVCFLVGEESWLNFEQKERS